MEASRQTLRSIGLVLFAAGVLLAFVLSALMLWADIEATSYGFPRLGKAPLGGLSCPPFMNRAEAGSFTVTLRNGTDRLMRPGVQVYISTPGIERWRSASVPLELEPGERQTVAWDVGAGDIVLNSFILVKAYTYATYPQPDEEGACGIFVVPIPWLSGTALYWLWLALSVALLFAGLWLIGRGESEAQQAEGSRKLARWLFAGLAVVALAAASAGWWAAGLIALVALALAVPAVLLFGRGI